jgi:uncharacterized membrane protein YidH (DUF202 family)
MPKKCPKCGFYNEDSANYCANCRYIINKNILVTRRLLLVSGIFIILLGIILTLISYYNSLQITYIIGIKEPFKIYFIPLILGVIIIALAFNVRSKTI